MSDRPKPEEITRFSLRVEWQGMTAIHQEDPRGDWVTYVDHIAALQAKDRTIADLVQQAKMSGDDVRFRAATLAENAGIMRARLEERSAREKELEERVEDLAAERDRLYEENKRLRRRGPGGE